MSTTTSSAEPSKLQTYSNIACSLDAEIAADSGRLRSALASFENSCREPAFRIHASYAASDMSRFANDARPTDEWVAKVGNDFAQADQGSLWPLLMPWAQPRFLGTQDAIENLTDAIFGSNIEILGFLATASASRGITHAKWQDFGRLLNALARNKHAGYVGRMDDFYQNLIVNGIPHGSAIDKLLTKLDSPAGRFGFFALSAGMGTYQDMKNETYGDNKAKAIGVNVIDGGMQYGIASTGVGGLVLAGNAAVQIGGNLGIAIDKTAADFISVNDDARDVLLDDAERRQEALDKMDLTNITKEFGETVYDSYASVVTSFGSTAREVQSGLESFGQDPNWRNAAAIGRALMPDNPAALLSIQTLACPPLALTTPLTSTKAGRDGLKDTGLAALNVVDGTADFLVASSVSLNNQMLATEARIANWLPFNDAVKQRMNRQALEMMRTNSALGNSLTNLIDIQV